MSARSRDNYILSFENKKFDVFVEHLAAREIHVFSPKNDRNYLYNTNEEVSREVLENGIRHLVEHFIKKGLSVKVITENP